MRPSDGPVTHEVELVAAIHMVSVLMDYDDDHDHDDHVLADDANFSLVLSLFFQVDQSRKITTLQDTFTDNAIGKRLRAEAERTGSHIIRDGSGGYKTDLCWDDDALKVSISALFDKESSS